MIDDSILLAAEQHLLALSPRPFIVWENDKWDQDDQTLLIIESIPGEPLRRSLAGTHEFTGIFQVSVRVPNFTGVTEAARIATSIQLHFYGAVLDGARVTHLPRRVAGYKDGDTHHRIPVQVRYRGFSKPAAT